MVRYLDTGIIDARIVRCLREAREFLYGSRSGGLPHRANSSTTNIYWCKRKTGVLIYPKNSWNFFQNKRFNTEEGSTVWLSANVRLKRRSSEFGLSLRGNYAHLSDGELDSTVRDVIADFPNVGCKRMSGLVIGPVVSEFSNRGFGSACVDYTLKVYFYVHWS